MYWMGEWELMAFQKASRDDRKYSAILRENHTGRTVEVQFGRPGFWHYKDSTGLGLYTKHDHLNQARRERFRERFGHYIVPQMYDPGYFSYHYLW
jgi:hypothetical protein